jgi:hypothetical protein
VKLSPVDKILDHRRLPVVLKQVLYPRLQFPGVHHDGFRIQSYAAVFKCSFDYGGKQIPVLGARLIIHFPGRGRDLESIQRLFGFDFIARQLENIGCGACVCETLRFYDFSRIVLAVRNARKALALVEDYQLFSGVA